MSSLFSPTYLPYWAALGALVITCAFFATSETSLFALSPLDRLRLRERDPARGEVVENILSRPRRLLLTVLIGVEFSSILFSVLATSLVVQIWGPHGEWLVLLIMAPIFQFVAEIIPKTLSLAYTSRIAGWMAPLVRPAIVVLIPFRVVFLQISKGLLAAMGFRPDIPVPTMHQDDFVRMVEESHQRGLIASVERDFIQNLLDFGELRVGQIMVPRPDMFTLPADLSFADIIAAVKQSRFSRVPVYEENEDQILGILHAKDILDLCAQDPCEGELPRHLLRPSYYVPENKKAFDLLNELQSQRQRQVLVVDEYGALVGLVTVEDLLEELFGDILQEFAAREQDLEQVSQGVWRVNSSMGLADFNDALGVSLPADGYDTIGGFVLNLHGALPREGQLIAYDHLTFRVLRMKGTRILELEVRRQES